MHSGTFLQDLAIVMLVAGAVTVAFHWLKQPEVLGYIVAGALIGPNVFSNPLISNEESIRTLADMGVVFLLFTLGLEFNFRKIRQLGPTAFIIAPLETGLMFLAGFLLGQLFGWRTMDCIYLGGVLMISSTTIITRTLAEMGRSREKFATVIYGVLIAEDIIAVLIIASLSAVAKSGGLDLGALVSLSGGIAVFLVVAIVLGLLVVPRVLGFVGRFRNDETLLIAVLAFCFGLSLLALKLGYSPGLGAFIMGAIVAEAVDIRRIERITAPVRDMFGAVFFVTIGLLINPRVIYDYLWPITFICAALVIGKFIASSFGSFVAGYDRGTSLRVGIGLAQIGEFSFIIAALGATLNVTSDFLYPITVAVSSITATLTPYLIRHADRVVALHDRLAPQTLLNYQRDYQDWMERRSVQRGPDVSRRIIRKIVLQLAINLALVAGIFLSAVFVDRFNFQWVRDLPRWTQQGHTVLWAGALVLSLPVLVAFFRKLQALSMLLAELSVREHESEKRKQALRALISNTLLFAGTVGVSLLLLLLSLPLLPSWEVLILLVVLAVITAVLLRAQFIRLYSRAQNTIRETLEREREHHHQEERRPLPPLLEEADLETLTLRPDSPAAGLSIRQLALRSRTGASIVVIQRHQQNIINPFADEVLQGGDQVLLLGSKDQLQAAAEVFRPHAGR
jgi:CPA2 family monovalent cation:H+ antiporter-2